MMILPVNLNTTNMGYDPEEDEDERLDFSYDIEEDEMCGACQESPCMCSDPEQTSTTLDW
jgi:hypothetical protein